MGCCCSTETEPVPQNLNSRPAAGRSGSQVYKGDLSYEKALARGSPKPRNGTEQKSQTPITVRSPKPQTPATPVRTPTPAVGSQTPALRGSTSTSVSKDRHGTRRASDGSDEGRMSVKKTTGGTMSITSSSGGGSDNSRGSHGTGISTARNITGQQQQAGNDPRLRHRRRTPQEQNDELTPELLAVLQEIWQEEEDQEAMARGRAAVQRMTARDPELSRSRRRREELAIKRQDSIMSLPPPEEEFPVPSGLPAVLPPERIMYDGYKPPVPPKPKELLEREMTPLSIVPSRATSIRDPIHPAEPPSRSTTIREQPFLPVPTERLPQYPHPDHSLRSTELQHRLAALQQQSAPPPPTNPDAAELCSQRPTAELFGQPPPSELGNAIIPDPASKVLHERYRNAVPFSPHAMEMPVPPAMSGVEPMQSRMGSPMDEDAVLYAMGAVGGYGFEQREEAWRRGRVRSLLVKEAPIAGGYTGRAGV